MSFNWAGLAMGLAGAGAGYLSAKNKKPTESTPWEPSIPYREENMAYGRDLYQGGMRSGDPWGTMFHGMGGRYNTDATGARIPYVDRSQGIPNIYPGGGKGLVELGGLLQESRLDRGFSDRPPTGDPRNYDPQGRYRGPGSDFPWGAEEPTQPPPEEGQGGG